MIIIITGASSGVGKYLMEHFEKKYKVYGTCNSNVEKGNMLAKVDVRDFSSVESWGERLHFEEQSKIVLINCAGISYNAFTHKSEYDLWRNVIDTNLTGTFNVIRTFLPAMRERGYGRIINMSSVVAQIGVMGTSAYAASKSGLWGLAKAIAIENASKNITINNINLGYCNIGMGMTQISEAQRNDLMKVIPAGRFGAPDEILKTVEFLIENEYINGTSIDLNGGLR